MAGLFLHRGNDVAAMADDLGARLCGPGDPLRAQWVFVGHRGLADWLGQRLAERFGVWANLRFLPLDALAEACLAGCPQADTRLDEAATLRWRIHRLLPEQPAWRGTHDPDGIGRLRQAEELARIYPRLVRHRRDELLRLAAGAQVDLGPWTELWRQLLGEFAGDDLVHRISGLLDGSRELAATALPQRLMAFSAQTASADQLALLMRLAEATEVHLYLFDPCRHYFGDVPGRAGVDAGATDAHPLLSRFGGASRAVQQLVFGYELLQPAEEHEYFRSPNSGTLLARLQRSLVELETVGPEAVDPADRSIELTAAPSRLREVELLQDRLLSLRDADPSLLPRDILVMVPRIGDYAAAIQAVFGSLAEEDPRFLPFEISERPDGDQNTLAGRLLGLARLATGALTREALLDLVESLAAAHAGFSGEDADRIAAATEAAGVRAGLDAGDLARQGAGRDPVGTVAEGNERLLLGWLLGDEEDFADTAPVAVLRGSDVDGFGRWLLLVDAVAALRRRARRARAPESPGCKPLTDWVATLCRFLDLLQPPEPGAEARQERAALEASLAALAAADPHRQPLSYPVLLAVLEAALAPPRRRRQVLTGGIAFCDLNLLRTAPFRVIALLGLDDGVLPRPDARLRDDPIAADLAAGRGRPTDRSPRQDDRQLLLEALSLAGDALILSHVGLDRRTGTVLPPSLLVSDLFEGIASAFGDATARRRQRQAPLSGTSPRHFDPGAADWQSYQSAWCLPPDAPPPSPFATLDVPASRQHPGQELCFDLEQLVAAFVNPARAFLREGLGIELPFPEDREQAAEAWAPEGLLRILLGQTPPWPERLQRPLAQRLGLPRGRLAQAWYDAARDQARRLWQAAGAAVELPAQGLEVRWRSPEGLAPPRFRLRGRIEHRGGQMLLLLPRQPSIHLRIAVRIRLLALAACWPGPTSARLLWPEGTGTKEHRMRPPGDPHQALRGLLWRAWNGRLQPLRFAPRAAAEWAKSLAARSGEGNGSGLSALRRGFAGGYRPGDLGDPWMALAWRDACPPDQDFERGLAAVVEALGLADDRDDAWVGS